MKQIVFLKQVPASTKINIDPVTHTLMRTGSRTQVNPDDLHALQMAVEIRKQLGGTIHAVSMGPSQAESVLREAMMYGADEAILLTDPAFAGSDTWSTSYILSSAVKRIGGASILLFGKQAIDGDTAQVGPGVAARLKLPQITEVSKISKVTGSYIIAEKMSDMGRQLLKASFPCVLTVSKEANELTAPTLRSWESANRKPIIRWTAAHLGFDVSLAGLNSSPTRVVNVCVPDSSIAISWVDSVNNLTRILKISEN